MNGNADRVGEVGVPSVDALTNPPGCVGRELVPLCVVELLNRTDQTEIAFLNAIEKFHFGTGVLLGDRHDQAEVGSHHLVERGAAIGSHPFKVMTCTSSRILADSEQVVRIHSRLDALRDTNFLFRGEQRILSDLLQVQSLKVLRIGYFSKRLRQFALVFHLFEKDKRLRDDVGRFWRLD